MARYWLVESFRDSELRLSIIRSPERSLVDLHPSLKNDVLHRLEEVFEGDLELYNCEVFE